MELFYHLPYEEYDDKKTIELVLSGNAEAMLYLIFKKYTPLLKKLYRRYYGSTDNYYYLEQLQVELFIHLKSDDWHSIRDFGWRSSFGTWLGTVAGNLFIKKMSELIGIEKYPVSIGEDEENGEIDLPDPGHPHEDDIHMIMLIEAIQRLEDKDQRFVLLKEFDGYSPKEIASQLELKRRKENRLKINKEDGSEIIPTAEYIHMLKGRAKKNLIGITNELRKEYEW
jgi:RNA polymerase sigma factor (sigma-70 family)